MDKMNKLSLPSTIIVGCLILGGFYYASQTSKQNSIERQQQVQLQETKEQQKREFSASQKEACLAIYKQESAKWNNTSGWRYDDIGDTCYIQYKESPKKTSAQCDANYQGDDGKVLPLFFTEWLLCKDGLFEKSF